ncbi:hypothetical protein [Lentzea aerocolonigenes]|uniref:hypothetical protein n=1 Tax=Lentzea aerocolonigenes TaxID=68170 RepID=UPI0004C2E9A9|nr:hypothetical protein [Lentzea aerocolonigenes]MCP2245839.1 hypothetical protein [Lentzea aerocolonigenes]
MGCLTGVVVRLCTRCLAPYRGGYLNDFRHMAARLAQARRAAGGNLGDPTNCPGPETSGTAFFTCGPAWVGVLNAATCRPVAMTGWNGMVRVAL